jgi:hypothetical protein
MQKWIALNTPEELNIPYFALPVPSSRENRIDRTISSTHSKYLSHAQRTWLRANGLTKSTRIVSTRNYDPPKTAVYVDWLVFDAEQWADVFLELFPSFNPEIRTAALESRIQALQHSNGATPLEGRRSYTQSNQVVAETVLLEREIRKIRFAQERAKAWATASRQLNEA